MPKIVTIDLDRVWKPIGVGIRRAYVFAGFGVNAANNPNHTDYHLPGLIKLSFAPQSAGGDLLGEYKQEFANWILGNALREVIESLEVTLGRLFEVCALVAQSKGTSRSRKVVRDFDRKGAAGRLQIIATQFGLTSRHTPYIESLTWLRNCLTHRQGVVAAKDCNDRTAPGLKVNYLRFQLEQHFQSGDVVRVPPDIQEPLFFKEQGALCARIVETERLFQIGSPISLSNPDIRDILFTCWNAGTELRSELLAYLKRLNIPVSRKEP
jgi:hypothetical protein